MSRAARSRSADRPAKMRVRPRSLRNRLVLLFALGTAVVIAVSGVAMYLILDRQTNIAVDQVLAARIDDVANTFDLNRAQINEDDAFALVLDTNGTVIASAAAIKHPEAVLHPDEVRSARTSAITIERQVLGLGHHARLLARPEDIGAKHFIVVAGVRLDAAVATEQRLIGLLVATAPVLVLVLAAGAWWIAGAALRPVTRLTAEAEEISRLDRGRRLADPMSGDEIGELARTLNHMLDRLVLAFEHEQAFVDDASHELRTPIAILRAELELVLSDEQADRTELRRAIASGLEEAERLGRLADDLLILARAGTVGVPLRPRSVPLAALAGRVVDRLGPRDPARAAIEVSGVGEAMVDAERMEQIILNLVTNADRFARQRILITVAPNADDATLDLTVADDGPGFPHEFVATAFDRFSRADPARRRDTSGTGLGLAIVAALTAPMAARSSPATATPSAAPSSASPCRLRPRQRLRRREAQGPRRPLPTASGRAVGSSGCAWWRPAGPAPW